MNPTSVKPIRLAVIGSSTAEGIGASSPETAWVARYKQHLDSLLPGCNILNLGKGGYSSYQLLPDDAGPFRARPLVDTLRNISKAIAFQPDAVIVNLPSNDTVSGHDADEQISNFKSIAQKALAQGILVWVCTPQPRALPPEQMAVQLEVRDRVLNDFGPFAIDAWTPLANPDGSMLKAVDSGDGTHLNDQGHQLLFEQVIAKNIPEEVAQFKAGSLEVPFAIQEAGKNPMKSGFARFFNKLFSWIRG
ncbi:MAG: SGNH/GDSL hydrolase family protein [Saprospiraceae bacterium]